MSNPHPVTSAPDGAGDVDARDDVTCLAADLFGTRDGWSWNAEPVRGAPGWHAVWQEGADSHDILIGGSTYIGPAGLVVTLSSNPFIHGFDQTAHVLNELGLTGLTGLTGDELAAEIARRTEQARRFRSFD